MVRVFSKPAVLAIAVSRITTQQETYSSILFTSLQKAHILALRVATACISALYFYVSHLIVTHPNVETCVRTNLTCFSGAPSPHDKEPSPKHYIRPGI